MFTKAIKELYELRDKYQDDKATVESIDKIIYELTSSVSTVLDIIAEQQRHKNYLKNN